VEETRPPLAYSTDMPPAACKRLYSAVLVRALDDLLALLRRDPLPGLGVFCVSNGRPRGTERDEMIDEVSAWFLDPADDSVVTLAMCCAAVGLRAESIRRKVRALVARGEDAPDVRRRRLSATQVECVRKQLAAGVPVRKVAAGLKIDEATVRKRRLKLERGRAMRFPRRFDAARSVQRYGEDGVALRPGA